MTFTDRLEAAIDDLAAYGITFVFDTSTQTLGDAWVDAVEQHGPRIAFVHEEAGHWVDGGIRFRHWGGEWITNNKIWVSFDHANPDDATKIAHVFAEQGFGVSWGGDPYTAVEVTLS